LTEGGDEEIERVVFMHRRRVMVKRHAVMGKSSVTLQNTLPHPWSTFRTRQIRTIGIIAKSLAVEQILDRHSLW